MKKYFNSKYVKISIIFMIVLGLIFVPVSITGMFARIYNWTNMVNYLDLVINRCADCYRLEINFFVYIPELIILFFISLTVLNLLNKKGIIK